MNIAEVNFNLKNDFENRINRLILAINNSGRGYGWQNQPKRSHETGTYLEGEPFDFIILSSGYNCVFDAKMTQQDNYKIMKKDIKQANNLFKCYMTGMDAFFLIYFFKKNTYRKIHILDFLNILGTKKNIKFEDCEKFRLERMF